MGAYYKPEVNGVKYNIIDTLIRMASVDCSDENVDTVIMHLYESFKFLKDWMTIGIFFLVLNIYIDYFGLTLSYGGTWNKMWRRI